MSVGTGNSRAGWRAEVLTWEQSFVALRRKDGEGGFWKLRPHGANLASIMNQPVD
jgi:hypothetical protein